MEEQWSVSSAHGHGYIVAPIAIWLAYRQRCKADDSARPFSIFDLAPLILSSVIWIIGDLTRINVIADFGVIALIPSIVLALYGYKTLRKFAFPLAFLFFMVPAGDFLVPWLVQRTTDATVWAVAQSGLPIYREGNQMTMPSGKWSVIETCAGLNYIVAACVLGSIYVHLTYTSLQKKIVFIFTLIAISLIANWMRAYLTVMTGHFTAMRWGPGYEHVVFGWVLFGVITGITFAFGARWSDDKTSGKRTEGFVPTRVTYAASDVDGSNFTNAANRINTKYALIACCVIGILLIFRLWAEGMHPSPTVPKFNKLNEIMKVLEPSDGDGFSPKFSGWRDKIDGRASNGVRVFVGYYSHQVDGFELASSENRMLDEMGQWVELNSEQINLEILVNKFICVKEVTISRNGGRVLVWNWYTSNGRESCTKLNLKIDTLQSLVFRQQDTAILASISLETNETPLPVVREKLLATLLSMREQLLSITLAKH
jgi:exosortase A